MRKTLVCFLFVLSIPPAFAHLPEGAVLPVWQWPAGGAPVLDGDLSEWQVVPEAYAITQDTPGMAVAEGELGRAKDPADLSYRLIVSWEAASNRLYFMWERFDDIIDLEFADGEGCCGQVDSIEIGVDADHSGGLYFAHPSSAFDSAAERDAARGRQAQGPHVQFGVEGKPWKWNWQHGTHWDNEPPYACCADSYARQGGHGEAGTTQAEWYVTPWDEYDQTGPELSVEHDLSEGAIIGLMIAPTDMDIETAGQRGAKWVLGGGRDVWKDAGAFSDFVLLPVDESLVASAVEGDSWGQIKAAMRMR